MNEAWPEDCAVLVAAWIRSCRMHKENFLGSRLACPDLLGAGEGKNIGYEMPEMNQLKRSTMSAIRCWLVGD
eukprot:scaffold281746_cov22-Tisochrysis_lutea.AAC.1